MDRSLLGSTPDFEKAKRIVCAIIAEAGGTFNGKTRLNKAFWWAHVHFYKHHRGLLSRYPIARLPEGPAIDDADDLLISLEQEGRINLLQEPVPRQPEPVTVFKLIEPPTELSDDDLNSIRAAVEWIKHKTGSQASIDSHRLSRAWQAGRNGDIIDIVLDALSDEDLAATNDDIAAIDRNLRWAEDQTRRMFGG